MDKRKRNFKKLHERAKQRIRDYLTDGNQPVLASSLQRFLKEDVQLSVTKPMIRRYLRQELAMTYKVIKPITCNHNFADAKLQ
jgi:hypothetical protein